MARFADAGLHFGIRAADFEDQYRFDAPFQICSADTERSRVYERKIWEPCEPDMVIVDEAHIQKGQTMRQILDDHKARGAKVILLTATPIGLSNWADEIVVSGTMKEYRDCKALVPAVVRSIEQPDLSKVKRSATGEYVIDGEKRKIYTQSIVGNVIDRWKRYNPDARPTMMYAPGKPESVWLTEQFQKIGVNFCHVDATDAVVDGKRRKLNRPLWDEILSRYEAGDIKGLSSRFKLREGIDVPFTYHCILATPIGSLASYIQTVGRVLRYSSKTPDHVLITDHGGNYWRHGSPNADRPWEEWWPLSEGTVSAQHQRGIKDHGEPEPIRCPKCEGERKGGSKCPHCGFEHVKSNRHVVMENGVMKEVDGPLIKPRVTKLYSDTQDKWDRLYWGYKKKKLNKSFFAMWAYFAYTHHYFPPKTLRNMPKLPVDWGNTPAMIKPDKLIGYEDRKAA
jgi:superfamily II DNA or RNA helicase